MALTHTWRSNSAAETNTLGQAIGQALMPGMILALCGNLGAGKTTFTQGIAAGLGVTDRVTSPTFIFVNEYPTAAGHTLIHIDSYRLGNAPDEAALEAFTFGIEEILWREDAIVVIEWADRLMTLLPTDHLQITLRSIDEQPESREIICVAKGAQSIDLIQQLSSVLEKYDRWKKP